MEMEYGKNAIYSLSTASPQHSDSVKEFISIITDPKITTSASPHYLGLWNCTLTTELNPRF